MLDEIEEDAFARRAPGWRVAGPRNLDSRGTSTAHDRQRRTARPRGARGKKKNRSGTRSDLQCGRGSSRPALSSLLVGGLGPSSTFARRRRSEASRYPADRGGQGAGQAEGAERPKYLEQYGSRATGKPTRQRRRPGFRELQGDTSASSAGQPVRQQKCEGQARARTMTPRRTAGRWPRCSRERPATCPRRWAKVKANFAEEAKLPCTFRTRLVKARWGWVADKKLADLKSQETGSHDWPGTAIEEIRRRGQDVRFGDDPTDRVATMRAAGAVRRLARRAALSDAPSARQDAGEGQGAASGFAHGHAAGPTCLGPEGPAEDTAARIAKLVSRQAGRAARELLAERTPTPATSGRARITCRDIRRPVRRRDRMPGDLVAEAEACQPQSARKSKAMGRTGPRRQ